MADKREDRKDQAPPRQERDGLKEHTTGTGVKEGFNNSEHELEVSGMRHAPDDRQRRREGYSKADIDEDVVVSQPTFLEPSEFEKREQARAAERGGTLIRSAGTSLHDELDRTRDDEARRRKKGDGQQGDGRS